jgi:hypothetical protein
MIKEKNNIFILILSDIGENSEGSEYLFRIIEVIIELPLSGFPEEYWKFGNVFLEEKIS